MILTREWFYHQIVKSRTNDVDRTFSQDSSLSREILGADNSSVHLEPKRTRCQFRMKIHAFDASGSLNSQYAQWSYSSLPGFKSVFALRQTQPVPSDSMDI